MWIIIEERASDKPDTVHIEIAYQHFHTNYLTFAICLCRCKVSFILLSTQH